MVLERFFHHFQNFNPCYQICMVLPTHSILLEKCFPIELFQTFQLRLSFQKHILCTISVQGMMDHCLFCP